MADFADMDGVLGPALSIRLADELQAALRRKPAQEARLAGVLQVLIPRSERLAEAAGASLDVLSRRGSFDRPLYTALLRGLVERTDQRANPPLVRALALEDGGGLSTFAAAALSNDPLLLEPLAKLASSRSSHIAFAAEIARATRGESKGERLAATALRIKESCRIELLSQVILPLVRQGLRIPGGASAFAILRDTERHLGRWLCLAEGGKIGGDDSAWAQANAAAKEGASGARAGWSLVAWALQPTTTDCETRPTLELMARLSDRPSAERELSFLFRMADAGLANVKSMLESLVRQSGSFCDLAIRASAYLVRGYGLEVHRRRLLEAAKSAKHEDVRGLALAAIYDIDPGLLGGLPLELDRSRQLQTAAWSALVRLALADGSRVRLMTEPTYRRLQLGWPD
jgi:hypothetical protein